jgi:hypothetical protein
MNQVDRIIFIRDNRNRGWERKPFKSFVNFFRKQKFGLFSNNAEKWIINPEYDHIIFKSMNGFNYFVLMKGFDIYKEGKYIFYNLDNGFIFSKPGNHWYSFDKNGLDKFEYNGKEGLVHVSGKIILEAKFDIIGKGVWWGGDINCIRVSLNNLFGFINIKGEWLIEPSLEDVGNWFDETHKTVAAKKNGYWGIIDSKGNWVLPAMFDDLRAPGLANKGYFDPNNYAIVTRNNKNGVVHRSGQILFEPIYDKLDGFGDYYFDESEKKMIKKEPLIKKDEGNIFDSNGKIEAFLNGEKVILTNLESNK